MSEISATESVAVSSKETQDPMTTQAALSPTSSEVLREKIAAIETQENIPVDLHVISYNFQE